MVQMKAIVGCSPKTTKYMHATAALHTSYASQTAPEQRRRQATNIPSRYLTFVALTMTIVLSQCLPRGIEAAALAAKTDSEETGLLARRLHAAAEEPERTRLRKRHSDYMPFASTHGPGHLDWANPCNGNYEPTDSEQQLSAEELRDVRKILRRQLRGAIRSEIQPLKDLPNSINIRDIKTWAAHEERYRFLPQIAKNSTVRLMQWYRDVQVYVGSFAQLGRTQHRWDQAKTNYDSNTTNELAELYLSARRILCEIETTINGSFPQMRKLSIFDRLGMDETLNFHTDFHSEQPVAADRIDLRFAKHHYIEYLRGMTNAMRHRGGKSSASSSKSLESSSLENATKESRSSRSQAKRKVSRQRRQRLSSKSAELPQFNQFK